MGTQADPYCYLDANTCRLFLRKSHCRHAGKEHRGDARPIEHCNHIHGYALSDPIGDELIGNSNAITHETPPDFILHSSNPRKPNHWHNRPSNAREPKRTTRQIFAVRVPRKNEQTLLRTSDDTGGYPRLEPMLHTWQRIIQHYGLKEGIDITYSSEPNALPSDLRAAQDDTAKPFPSTTP